MKGALSSRAHAEKAFQRSLWRRKSQCSYKAGNKGADEETNTDRAGLQTSQSSRDDNCAASLNVTDCKKRHFIKLRFIRFHSSQNNLDKE